MTAIGRIGIALTGLYSLVAVSPGSAAEFLRGPVTGLVRDSRTGSIRRIDGIPGGATMSGPIAVEIAARSAAFARSHEFAVVADADGSVRVITHPAAEQPAVSLIESAMGGVELVAMDGAAGAAALYSPGSNTVQLMKGLPAQPVTVVSTQLDSAVAGPVEAIIPLPGAAGVVLAAKNPGGGSRILRLSAGGEWSILADAGGVSALVARSETEVLFADPVRNELVLVRGNGGGSEQRILANERDGVAEPRGLCLLADGRTVLVNAGPEPHISSFDAEGKPAGKLRLGFTPEGCENLGPGNYLQLNQPGSGPLYLLDYSEDFRVMFVPAGNDGNGGKSE